MTKTQRQINRLVGNIKGYSKRYEVPLPNLNNLPQNQVAKRNALKRIFLEMQYTRKDTQEVRKQKWEDFYKKEQARQEKNRKARERYKTEKQEKKLKEKLHKQEEQRQDDYYSYDREYQALMDYIRTNIYNWSLIKGVGQKVFAPQFKEAERILQKAYDTNQLNLSNMESIMNTLTVNPDLYREEGFGQVDLYHFMILVDNRDTSEVIKEYYGEHDVRFTEDEFNEMYNRSDFNV